MRNARSSRRPGTPPSVRAQSLHSAGQGTSPESTGPGSAQARLAQGSRAATLAAAYHLPAEEVVALLGTDTIRGLSSDECARRLEGYGPNLLRASPSPPVWRTLLAQFQSPLVVLLLIATLISVAVWLVERDSAIPYEALVISVIVLLNAVLGYMQEERAEASMAALRAMAAPTAAVIRDGVTHRIATADLVPGDLLVVEEGDTIAADARVVSVTDLQTAEAALTGESEPVMKDCTPIDEECALGDRHTMLFAGTAVSHGRGRAIVTATGEQTEVGRIAQLLAQTHAEATPLQREIAHVSTVLGWVVVVIAAVVGASILVIERPHTSTALVDVLILSVSLAVAAVPEGLATTLTVVLALGVQRMARRNVIIRRLSAVETLGSATVVATDKTGTLTKNEMTVRTLVTVSGQVEVRGSGYAPDGVLLYQGRPLEAGPLLEEITALLGAAERASNAALQEHQGTWVVHGDPTEGALVVAARKTGLDPDRLDERFIRLGEVPFSSERKLMSTVHADATRPGWAAICTKGAPDLLLARCTHEQVGAQVRPLTADRCAVIRETVAALASEALRTLGVAYRADLRLTDTGRIDPALEQNLVFLGLVGMIDPPRPEAKAAVQTAHEAGIRVLMITGDHPRTASAIAADLGIATPGAHVLTGAELEQVPDGALDSVLQEVAVCARVNPEHKLRIVTALKRGGEVVAMTGDGVNDAPALKAADIGVAMGRTGTDVARGAADMVLTDDNFASIVAAVEEGRAIFANIQKVLRYLLSSNVGEVLVMFFGIVLAPIVGLSTAGTDGLVLPLLATQILWINLVTDTGPALALGLDPGDPAAMRRPPRPRGSHVIDRAMWLDMGFIGVLMAAGTLLVLDSGLPGGLIAGTGTLPHAQTLAFTTLVLLQVFNVFNARSDERSAFHQFTRNGWLWLALAVSLALQVLVVYLPPLQQAFTTTALSLDDWLLCVTVSSSVLWLREALKVWQHMQHARRS